MRDHTSSVKVLKMGDFQVNCHIVLTAGSWPHTGLHRHSQCARQSKEQTRGTVQNITSRRCMKLKLFHIYGGNMRLSCISLIFPGIEQGKITINFLLRKDIFCFKFSEFKPKSDKKYWGPQLEASVPETTTKEGSKWRERGQSSTLFKKWRGGSYLGFMGRAPGPSAFDML